MIVHDAASYRDAVANALAGGSRFGGLHASEGGRVVRAALVTPAGLVDLVSVRVEDGCVPTVVDLAPAAGWDER